MSTYVGQETMALGVVVERRVSDHPWQDYSWHAVSVIPKAPPLDPAGEWRVLVETERATRLHAGTLNLSLFRKETDGYKVNLSQTPPRVFVVLRRHSDPGSPHEVVPFHVTADAFEAQIYLDNGDDLVDPVEMPELVAAWVKDYCDRNHVDQPFRKRQRKPHPGKAGDPVGGGRG